MDCAVQVTILRDNTATRPGVAPSHGLAMLVETGGRRVLYDTGPDDLIVASAGSLGVRLYPLDAVVLSHGHADHTGGLAAVLQVAGPVRVIAHPGVFDRTFSGPAPGRLREITMPLPREAYEALGARFVLTEMPVPVVPGLLSTGHVPPLPLAPGLRAGLWRSHEDTPRPDDFRDDCSLVATLDGGTAVLTGCAHPGAANILYKAYTIAPDGPPRVLIGGLHLGSASREQVEQLAREIADLGVCLLLPCHCTGEDATRVLTESFAGEVMPVGAGSVIRIHQDGDTEVRYPAASASIATRG